MYVIHTIPRNIEKRHRNSGQLLFPFFCLELLEKASGITASACVSFIGNKTFREMLASVSDTNPI